MFTTCMSIYPTPPPPLGAPSATAGRSSLAAAELLWSLARKLGCADAARKRSGYSIRAELQNEKRCPAQRGEQTFHVPDG